MRRTLPLSVLVCGAISLGVLGAGVVSPTRAMADDNRPGLGEKLDSVHPSYRVVSARPEGIEMPVGGLAVLSDGRLVVARFDAQTLRAPRPTEDPNGEVWLLSNTATGDPADIEAELIAEGLFEPSGCCVVDGVIYVSQRDEVSRFTFNERGGFWDQEAVAGGWETNDFHQLCCGLLHEPSEEEGHPRPVRDRRRRGWLPLPLDRRSGPSSHLVRHPETPDRAPYRGLRNTGQLGLGMRRSTDRPLHVRLPGAQPDITDQNILKDQSLVAAPERHHKGAAGRPRRDLRAPAAATISGRRHGRTAELELDRASRHGGPPDWGLAIALDHHVGPEQRGRLNLSHSQRKQQCVDEAEPHEAAGVPPNGGKTGQHWIKTSKQVVVGSTTILPRPPMLRLHRIPSVDGPTEPSARPVRPQSVLVAKLLERTLRCGTVPELRFVDLHQLSQTRITATHVLIGNGRVKVLVLDRGLGDDLFECARVSALGPFEVLGLHHDSSPLVSHATNIGALKACSAESCGILEQWCRIPRHSRRGR